MEQPPISDKTKEILCAILVISLLLIFGLPALIISGVLALGVLFYFGGRIVFSMLMIAFVALIPTWFVTSLFHTAFETTYIVCFAVMAFFGIITFISEVKKAVKN